MCAVRVRKGGTAPPAAAVRGGAGRHGDAARAARAAVGADGAAGRFAVRRQRNVFPGVAGPRAGSNPSPDPFGSAEGFGEHSAAGWWARPARSGDVPRGIPHTGQRELGGLSAALPKEA